MGNCSTEQDSISVPQQEPLEQTQNKFFKPEPCLFITAQPQLQPQTFSKQGIKSKIVNLNSQQPDLELKKALQAKDRYVDIHFKAEKKSIGQKFHLEHLEWKRPQSMGKGKAIFFSGDLETLDLKQGHIENSYFVSSFGALRYREDSYAITVQRIFDNEIDYSYKGVHGIWLFLDGSWKCIVIDDLLPCCLNQYPFTKYENESWIMLIEKAYAKFFRSYENIEKGLAGHFLTAITGAPSYYLNRNSNKTVQYDEAWGLVKESLEKKYIVLASSQNCDRNKYLNNQSTFSYSVIDCQEVYILTSIKKKRERILKLDNCWGRYEWKGRWSEYSDVWSEELRHQLGYEKADDSIMWINIEDLVENFGQICVCKFNPEYLNTSLELAFCQGQSSVKGVFIYIHQRTQGFLTLTQKDHKHFFKDYHYSMCRMILLQIDKQAGKLKQIMAEVTDCDAFCTIQITLNPGIYYILVEMDWKCSFTRSASLGFYGDQPMKMCLDQNMPSIDSIFYELCRLDQEKADKVQVHYYPDDPNIKKVRGQFAGYIYLHYVNNSQDNRFLSEKVSLENCKNIEACNEKNPNEFTIKLMPGQEKLVKLKIKKQGNGHYEFKPKVENKMFEKYSTENLMEMLRKKPSSLKRREIDGEKVDVFIKMFEYSGGVALLYENRMSKYSFIEEIGFEVKNLWLENERLEEGCRYNLELEPDCQKLFSFLVVDPNIDYVFKTKVSYYLSSPEFTF